MKKNIHTASEKELRDEERISAYMRGAMNKEEEMAFMEELKTDDDLRSKAVDLSYLAKGMKSVGEERDRNVKEALFSVNRETAKQIAADATKGNNSDVRPNAAIAAKKVSMRHRIATFISAAACITVLCIVGIRYYNYRTVTDLGEQYSSTFVNYQSISRGGENEQIAKELSFLYANVQEGKDLDATIKRLSVLWEVSTMDTYNDYTNEASLIGWNLVIAELKNNDKNAAKEVLATLISKPEISSEIKIKAKELQAKL